MKYFIGVTTYDRPELLGRLVEQLVSAEYAGSSLEVLVLDDASPARERVCTWDCFKRPGWGFRAAPRRRGKRGFYAAHNELMAAFLRSDASVYLVLPDDMQLSRALFPVLDHLFGVGACDVLNLHRDARLVTGCWGSGPPAPELREVEGVPVDLQRTGWVDGAFAATRRAVEVLYPVPRIERPWRRFPQLGSGVGQRMSEALRRAGIPVHHATRSLVQHCAVASKMNYEARLADPLETLDFLP